MEADKSWENLSNKLNTEVKYESNPFLEADLSIGFLTEWHEEKVT